MRRLAFACPRSPFSVPCPARGRRARSGHPVPGQRPGYRNSDSHTQKWNYSLSLPIQADPATLTVVLKQNTVADITWRPVEQQDSDQVRALRAEINTTRGQLQAAASDILSLSGRIAFWQSQPNARSTTRPIWQNRRGHGRGPGLPATGQIQTRRRKSRTGARPGPPGRGAAPPHRSGPRVLACENSPGKHRRPPRQTGIRLRHGPVRLAAPLPPGRPARRKAGPLLLRSGNVAKLRPRLERHRPVPGHHPAPLGTHPPLPGAMDHPAPARTRAHAPGQGRSHGHHNGHAGSRAHGRRRTHGAPRRHLLPSGIWANAPCPRANNPASPSKTSPGPQNSNTTLRPAEPPRDILPPTPHRPNRGPAQGQALFLADGVLLGKRPFSLAGDEADPFFGSNPLVSGKNGPHCLPIRGKGIIGKKQTHLWAWTITATNHTPYPAKSSSKNPRLNRRQPHKKYNSNPTPNQSRRPYPDLAPDPGTRPKPNHPTRR